jgi:hypothetical protein
VSAYNNRGLAQRNQSLEKENRRLRDEVGELSIEDESQLHAIRLPNKDYFEWTWRIWIPRGRGYRVRCVDGKIPAEGWPEGTGGGTITLREPGEHVVRYRVLGDPKDGRHYGSLSTRSASVGKNAHPWVEWPSQTSTTDGVGTTTRAFPTTEPRVELCRHRVSQASSSTDIEDPAAGFLIWLEPIP